MKLILMILIASFSFTAQTVAGVAAPNLTSINIIHNPAAEGLKVSSGEIHTTSIDLSTSSSGSSYEYESKQESKFFVLGLQH